jgi:DeoR family glycerol-3-phosphate regulon repressor
MMASAARSIMAVDASKFQPQDRKPALRQPDLKEGDILVTDLQLPDAFRAPLAHLDIRVAG